MIEPGQLRRWIVGVNKCDLFVILEHFYIGAGAWWILTPKGRDWEPHDEIEDFSEVIG
jgi:hypothetical protein